MPWYIVPFILQFSNGTSNPSYVLNLWLPFLPPARENSVFKWCMWLNHAHMDNLLIYLREAVPCNIIESWESNPSYLKSQGWYLACIRGERVENLESHLRILPTAVPLLTLESIKKKRNIGDDYQNDNLFLVKLTRECDLWIVSKWSCR